MIDPEAEFRDALRPDHARPLVKEAFAAALVFVVLPGLTALAIVGAYLAWAQR